MKSFEYQKDPARYKLVVFLSEPENELVIEVRGTTGAFLSGTCIAREDIEEFCRRILGTAVKKPSRFREIE